MCSEFRARFLVINGTDIPEHKIVARMKKARMTGQKIQYTRNHKCIERNRGSPRRRKSSSLGLVISPCSVVGVTTTSCCVPLLTLEAPHSPQNAPDTCGAPHCAQGCPALVFSAVAPTATLGASGGGALGSTHFFSCESYKCDKVIKTWSFVLCRSICGSLYVKGTAYTVM